MCLIRGRERERERESEMKKKMQDTSLINIIDTVKKKRKECRDETHSHYNTLIE
jgi:hypothetical protein